MDSNKQKILAINTSFDSIHYDGLVYDEFRSATSFLDYDAIIIDTSHLAHNYGVDYTSTYMGKRLIAKYDSQHMIDDFSRTKQQLVEFLKQGKNLFVLMATNESCFIHTGKTEYSGTGKNARGTDFVTEIDTFSFLPIDLNPVMVSGEKFDISCQPPYSTFFQATKDITYYDAYFNVPKKSALLTIPKSDKAISAVFEYEKGKIIILPYPFDEDHFETQKEWKKYGKKYLNALFELNNALTFQTDSYVFPLWSNNIKILNEKDEEENLEQDLKKLRNLEAKIKKKEDALNEIRRKKLLLTAGGTLLEQVVKETLQEIGITLEETEIGRSDVVATYKDKSIVAEIKSASKSAAEKHAAQLEKWVSQFIEEKEHSPKAILIVNGFCDTPLAERTEDVFPNQMLKFCMAREHALITTTQLLCLYIEIKNNPACAEERIVELLNCVGKYPRYLDYENYLKLI
ncbi:MAG: hypothetical protein IJ398_05710 [Clostridia bacterium]|nr:hypothetical protein [Clostridia bacterium]